MKVLIVIENGLVQGIYSDDHEQVVCMVADRDTDLDPQWDVRQIEVGALQGEQWRNAVADLQKDGGA